MCEEGKRIDKCDYCDKYYCRRCYEDDEVDITYTAVDVSNVAMIADSKDQQAQLHCIQCIKGSVAMVVSLERKRLQEAVNRQWKVEMEALRRQSCIRATLTRRL